MRLMPLRDTTAAEFADQFERVAETLQHRLEQPDVEASNVDISYAVSEPQHSSSSPACLR